jgi:hypothetical protein
MTAAHECEAFALDAEEGFCLNCGHAACEDCEAVHALSGHPVCLSCLEAEGLEDVDEARAEEAQYRQALANLAANPSLADPAG